MIEVPAKSSAVGFPTSDDLIRERFGLWLIIRLKDFPLARHFTLLGAGFLTFCNQCLGFDVGTTKQVKATVQQAVVERQQQE